MTKLIKDFLKTLRELLTISVSLWKLCKELLNKLKKRKDVKKKEDNSENPS